MIRKMLIANRGEIAVRVIRTCRLLGIRTVVTYSVCDKDTLAVFMADEAICIGKNEPSNSYLNVSAILAAARQTGCDAIHPGYGFISENANFAKEVFNQGILFIGPSYKILEKTSDKLLMKKLVEKLGVPVIPSADAVEEYPFMIKANFGGGGRGIRVVRDKNEYATCLESSKKEMNGSFGDNKFFLEKVIDTYKHIDVQFMVDKNGRITLFPSRDCSVQRHYQKVIEETPVVGVSKKLLGKIEQSAIQIITKIGYDNLGTIEFLIDKDMNYYFVEINPRLQVEHTVTEEATGLDLVEQQILLAMGNDNVWPEKVLLRKHAIECRIMAKNVGELNIFNMPSGKDVRVDTFVYQGYAIKPFYDSLIAKIIISDVDRKRAITKMKIALDEIIIRGIGTNVDELYQILCSSEYASGRYSSFEETTKCIF